MRQTSSLTRKLAEAQETHARQLSTVDSETVVYRLYTEDRDNLVDLTRRYFSGATFTYGVGIWQYGQEVARIIDIVGKRSDLQAIVNLAGDIRQANAQDTVLVTWHGASMLLVGEPK